MGKISASVEKLELLNEKLSELYRSELESEICNAHGQKLFIRPLTSYNGDSIENYHFSVDYENTEAAIIFPFRKVAFCRRLKPIPPAFMDDLDEFGLMQNILERRGYSVNYGIKEASSLIKDFHHSRD